MSMSIGGVLIRAAACGGILGTAIGIRFKSYMIPICSIITAVALAALTHYGWFFSLFYGLTGAICGFLAGIPSQGNPDGTRNLVLSTVIGALAGAILGYVASVAGT